MILRWMCAAVVLLMVASAKAQDCGVWLEGPASPDLPLGVAARTFGQVNGDLYALTDSPSKPIWRLRASLWTAMPWDAATMGSVQAMTADGGQIAVVSALQTGMVSFPTPQRTVLYALRTFDGTTWTTVASREFVFGTGISGSSSVNFRDLTIYNGNWYVCGSFNSSSGINASSTGVLFRAESGLLNQIASTNSGGCTLVCLNLPTLLALQVGEDGLYVGGKFSSIIPSGGAAVTTNNLVKFDGTQFLTLGQTPNDNVKGMFLENSIVVGRNLILWGDFTQVGALSTPHIARWNSFNQSWTGVGSGLSVTPAAVVQIQGSGGVNDIDLVAVGVPQAGGVNVEQAAQWTGSAWQQYGGTGTSAISGTINCAASFAGVMVGGSGLNVNGEPRYGVARWSGSAWANVAVQGTNGIARAVTTHMGEVYVGGDFTRIDGLAASRIARLNPAGVWQTVGGGIDGPVHALLSFNGRLVAGGAFANAGGAPASNIAALTGSLWQPLGNGLNGTVYGLAASGGSLVAVGSFTASGATTVRKVAIWNGVNWSTPDAAFNPADLYAATYVSPSSLVVGGAGGVYQLSGSTFLPLGGNVNGAVYALASQFGLLYVGGEFTTVGSPAQMIPKLARWNGAAWSALGTPTPGDFSFGTVRGLALGTAEVVAVGDFGVNTAGGLAQGAARFDTAWHKLPEQFADGLVRSVVQNGPRYCVAGDFKAINAVQSFSFAQWSRTPVFTMSPTPSTAMVCGGGAGTGSVSFSVAVIGNPAPTLQWYRNGTALMDSLRVNGATTPTLTIFGVSSADAGTYTCTAFDSCGGSSTRNNAVLSVCIADFNCTGGVTLQDIFDFLTAWFGGDMAADVNGVGGVTLQDIFDFLTAWFAGC